jgi:hypothetical protein
MQMSLYRIPASVILAQAILESSSGSSLLAKRSNNHFGIKCHKEWVGDTVLKDDDLLNECFRKYNSIEDSYYDHSHFLTSRPRYAHLFKLGITDYQSWCKGLKVAGYATNNTYAEDLIKLIEGANLYALDGIDKMKSAPPIVVKREIKNSPFVTTDFSLRDFTFSGYLWQDERDILVQSLDMIITDRDDRGILVKKK